MWRLSPNPASAFPLRAPRATSGFDPVLAPATDGRRVYTCSVVVLHLLKETGEVLFGG
jgi:hypothetical protein